MLWSVVSFSVSVLPGASVLPSASAEDTPEKFPIKLFRPAKAGDRYKLTAHDTNKQVTIISQDGKVVRTVSQDFSFEFAAEVTVVKVDDKGHVLKKSIVIERFVDGKKNALLKTGEVVTAESLEGVTVFRLDSKPLPRDVFAKMKNIIHTKTTDRSDDDAVFGSKVEQAVGGKWSVSSVQVAKALKVDANKISGTATLKARKKVNGVDCLEIVTEITVSDSFPNAKQYMDGGFKLLKPSMTLKMTSHYPIDSKKQRVGGSSSMILKATMVGDKPELKGRTIQASFEMTSRKTMTPLE